MDRWSAKVFSPVDIESGVDPDKYGPAVVVHPGWGKSPQRHARLLIDLANNGFLPLGVDTRYAYADQQRPQPQLWKQPRTVGSRNPYFEAATRSDNQYQYRRPTALLDVCARLGIGLRSYVGHSDGGRISTLAAVADPSNTDKLVIVNGAGTGDSSNGVRRLGRSNANQIRSLLRGQDDVLERASSALGSTFYATTHLRRTLAEKQVIQQTDTWEHIDHLAGTGIQVTVAHAEGDELIDFEECATGAAQRPWINFVTTEGGHNNVYEAGVRSLIVKTLQN